MSYEDDIGDIVIADMQFATRVRDAPAVCDQKDRTGRTTRFNPG
jgi:hypothetical protein